MNNLKPDFPEEVEAFFAASGWQIDRWVDEGMSLEEIYEDINQGRKGTKLWFDRDIMRFYSNAVAEDHNKGPSLIFSFAKNNASNKTFLYNEQKISDLRSDVDGFVKQAFAQLTFERLANESKTTHAWVSSMKYQHKINYE